MLKKGMLFHRFRRLVYGLAMTLPGMLLQVTTAFGQVEPVEQPVPESSETETFVGEATTDASASYDWSKEEQYYDEAVEMRNIDENSWKKAIEGLDYSKEVNSRKKKEKVQSSGARSNLPGSSLFGKGEFFLWLFRGILLLAGIVAILLIVKNVVQLKPKPKNVAFQPQVALDVDLEHIEENLHMADLNPLLQRAIEQENYTLAVRLYYLSILKKLSQQNLVFWKKDKTNRDYLRELSATTLYQPFQESTRAFEWVWYGNALVEKQDFEFLQGQFQNTLSLIPQNDRP